MSGAEKISPDSMISAFSDGELDPAETQRIEALLAESPEARQQLAAHRETTALLREAFHESNFASGTRPIVTVRRRMPVSWRRMAIAASILLTLGVGYGMGIFLPGPFTATPTQIAADVAREHRVYSRETVHLVEVPAAQSDHLKAWLGNRVHRALVIPDLREAGLTFAGGRLAVTDGIPVAELMYTRPTGLPIAICIYASPGQAHAIQLAREGDTGLAAWTDGTHGYVVVGESDGAFLRSLAEKARQQL